MFVSRAARLKTAKTGIFGIFASMFFRQFFDQPLAQASYMIGCQATGEAIVVDPLRDIAPYLRVAADERLRVTHVTETHIHADFVSGARELVAATGAHLFLSAEGGAEWQYGYARADHATLLHHGDVIHVGNIRCDVLHTPGHTPEHLSFVVTDTPRAVGPMGILTGDFVFVGDVGRPDLLEKAAGVANTMDAAARTLFHSLARFRELPDYLQVWPGHGAGSACGKALGAVPFSTVGYEQRANWGVSETSESAFVAAVLDGQPEPPRYFATMKRINRDGPAVLHGLPQPPRLSPSILIDGDRERWIIDLRPAEQFAEAHVPRSLSIPYTKTFSTWVGSLVPYSVDIVLLASTAEMARAATHDLCMIGMDRVAGWIEPAEAMRTWTEAGRALSSIPQLTVSALAECSAAGDAPTVIDVRGESEWRQGHIPNAVHIPLGDLFERAGILPAGELVVQCQSGTRSAIAASVLKRLGRTKVKNLVGGYSAFTQA